MSDTVDKRMSKDFSTIVPVSEVVKKLLEGNCTLLTNITQFITAIGADTPDVQQNKKLYELTFKTANEFLSLVLKVWLDKPDEKDRTIGTLQGILIKEEFRYSADALDDFGSTAKIQNT